MRYWANLNKDNIVTQVIVCDDDKEKEWLTARFEGDWIETFLDQTAPYNFATKGGSYDPEKKAFIPEQDFPSWILNENTLQWEAPVKYPQDGKPYSWNEDELNWTEIAE